MAPAKGFRLVRAMHISQEKDKEQSQKCKENIFLKTYFLLFVVIAREH